MAGRIKKTAMLVGIAALVLGGVAQADSLDLTTAGASGFLDSGYAEDAFFIQIDPQSTGTGVINTFVRITDNDGDEHGYNTTVNGVLDTDSDDPHNHEIRMSEIPVVNLSGIFYRQFLLDLDEPNAANKAPISLSEIQIFLSGTPNQSVETFTGGVVDLLGTLIYRLDNVSDHTIELNGGLNSGNGSGDMFAYIPDSLFTGPSTQYVYLYSSFGVPNEVYGSFEEWAALEPSAVIPEPATLSLLGLGLAGMALRRAYKRIR